MGGYYASKEKPVTFTFTNSLDRGNSATKTQKKRGGSRNRHVFLHHRLPSVLGSVFLFFRLNFLSGRNAGAFHHGNSVMEFPGTSKNGEVMNSKRRIKRGGIGSPRDAKP